MTIVNGLHLVVQEVPNTTHVQINSDCQAAISILSGDYFKSKDKDILFAYEKFWSIVEATNIQFEMKHVRAHNGTKDTRFWINNWCDKHAKKGRKNAITPLSAAGV